MHGDCEHDLHTGAILKTYADHLEVMTPPSLRTTLNPLQTMRYSLLFPEKSFSNFFGSIPVATCRRSAVPARHASLIL